MHLMIQNKMKTMNNNDIFGLKVRLNNVETKLEDVEKETDTLAQFLQQFESANWFRKTLLIMQHSAVLIETIIKIVKIIKEK